MRSVVVLILVSLLGQLAWANQLMETPRQTEAMRRLMEDKFPSARNLAEKELAERKGRSIWAQYVLGVVHAEGEGNLARGLFLIRKAKDLLTEEFGAHPELPLSQRWHKRILMREQSVLGMLDRREDQLRVLAQYDEHYPLKRDAWRIWPLLKLGRFDQARAVAQKLISDVRPYIRERAFNGLLAIEEEAGNRESSYEWGLRGLADTRSDSCIIATNLALGARRTFRFKQTITHDQTALKAKDRSCPTSPHAQLAAMYLVFGEYQKSLSSLKALRAAPRKADMKVQNEMVVRARFVELLLALGAFKDATVRARQIIDAPDRAGMISAAAETVELTNNLLAWSVFHARQEQLLERVSARPFLDGLSDWLAAKKLANAKRKVARQAIRLSSLPDILVKVVRPYFTDHMLWYGGDIIEILGSGVLAKSVREARKKEREIPETAGYFLDVYDGEATWRDGRFGAAANRGIKLLKDLPKDTRLLRMRIHAWVADALNRKNRMNESGVHFHTVLNFYPTVLRHLRIRLPVQLTLSGPHADEIGDRLRDSPRLKLVKGAPFKVRVSDEKNGIYICLEGQKQYGCGHIEPSKLDADIDVAAAAIDAFHDEVFSPRIELTQSDINSLDGRSVRQNAQQAIDSLLGKDPKKKKKKGKR